MALDIRPITSDEVTAFRFAVQRGFGNTAQPEGEDHWRALMPLDRTLAAFDGETIVATLGDFPLRATVPGGSAVDMAGTTMVTVRPTHRRRGILRDLMRRHLDDAARRGDPLAGLWASEPGIYGRFGYGLATELHDLTISTRITALAPGPSDVRTDFVEPEQVADLVPPLWRAVAPSHPGFLDRSPERWQAILADLEHQRDGASELRHVIARRGAAVVGYVSYRQRRKWSDEGVPDGTVEIADLIGSDPAAERALWQFVTNVDLFPNVRWWKAPIDDPLILGATNARGVRRVTGDALYVRVLDVAAALHARRFDGDDELTLAIADPEGHAGGTFRLGVERGVASVDAVEGMPDASIDVRELGALYLGRSCASGLAAVGRIDADPSVVRRLDRLFRTASPPWCPEVF